MQFAGLKVVGYTRVSTDDQAERGGSLAFDQPAKVRALASSMGLDLVEIVEDAGECSKSLDRPGMRRVLAMLASGEVRGLVVARMNRLSRHVGDVSRLVEEHFIAPDGCHLFSASEAVETRTAGGRLMIHLMASVDQHARELIVENTAGAMAGKRSRSERTGNLRFGQAVDPDDLRRSKAGLPVAIVPCEADLATLALIRELRAGGHSLQAIADELNRRGIPSKRGVTKRSTGRWSKSTIGEILQRAGLGPADQGP